MTDPLSPATRATKRNLLVASVLAISANAFNVSIEKIPVAGLSIAFDDRLFAFLLLIVLAYFVCTFMLYYFIDIKNIKDTPHQSETEAWFANEINQFNLKYAHTVVFKDLQKLIPSPMSLGLTPEFPPSLLTGQWKPSCFTISEPRVIPERVTANVALKLNDFPAIFPALNDRAEYWRVAFLKAEASNRRRATFVHRAIRFIYFTRNYFFDGLLPIALGIFALVAILGHIDLAWIQNYLPSFKALSAHK